MAEAIRDGLRLEAIAADIAGDGDTALELLSVYSYDIAVLDRDIPGPTGDEVAERIVALGAACRSSCSPPPTVSTTTPGSSSAPTIPHEPFELRELVLRLRAPRPRRAHHRPPVREIAGLRLDPFRREVYRDGRYVALTRNSSQCSKSSSPPKAVSSAPKSSSASVGRERRPVHQRPAHHGLSPAQTPRRTLDHRHCARRRLPHRHGTRHRA